MCFKFVLSFYIGVLIQLSSYYGFSTVYYFSYYVVGGPKDTKLSKSRGTFNLLDKLLLNLLQPITVDLK